MEQGGKFPPCFFPEASAAGNDRKTTKPIHMNTSRHNIRRTAALLAAAAFCLLAACGKDSTDGDDGNNGNGGGNGGGGVTPPPVEEQVIYAAPGGFSNNEGTFESPYDLKTAISKLRPGWTLYLRGGEYNIRARIDMNKNIQGTPTASSPIRIWAYADEKPVINCRHAVGTADNPYTEGIRNKDVDYVHWKGLELKNAWNHGFRIEYASHNTYENCVSHHNSGAGFFIGFSNEKMDRDDINPDGESCAYNVYINCDAYMNFDYHTYKGGGTEHTPGTNADGFAAKCKPGKGNKYYNCRAWSNSDDGWDLYEATGGVEMINCWCWRTSIWTDYEEMYKERIRWEKEDGIYKGNFADELTEDIFKGNGNGFKMGGACYFSNGANWENDNHLSRGIHVLRHCISFNNLRWGFDQNNHVDGAYVENCIAFNNGNTKNLSNFGFRQINMHGTKFVFRNCISFGAKNRDSFTNATCEFDHNSWNEIKDRSKSWTPFDATASYNTYKAQFISLSEEDAGAPRKADGSLPDRFGRLAAGSIFIDMGAPTADIDTYAETSALGGYDRPDRYNSIILSPIPYSGPAPDLGMYEYGN